MAERLHQLASQLSSRPTPPHPLDPLSISEIEYAVAIVRRDHGQLGYNAITLAEPKKKELQAWLANPNSAPRPRRQAEVIAIGKSQEVYDGVVDLGDGKILIWEKLEGVQPLVSLSSLSSYVMAERDR